MPLYELVVVMRNMRKPEIAACMKRTGEFLLNNGVVLRAVENLGVEKEIAFKMPAHGKVHSVGAFALYRFNGRTDHPEYFVTELRRDVDIVKTRCVSAEPPREFECTLEEELQIPMHRPSVQKLIATGKRVVKENPIREKIKGPF